LVDPDVLETKILKLRGYLRILKGLKKYSLAQYTGNPLIKGSVERYLQLSIECLLDMGNHIISDLGLRKAEDYQDVFIILCEARVIPKAFAIKIAPMAGFRNILVHDYMKLADSKVYHILQKNLTDFEKFVKYIARYLEKE